MDPNETLRLIREEAAALIDHDAEGGGALAEHVRGLDEWLTKGGFPPNAWTETPVAFPTRDQIAAAIDEQTGPEVGQDLGDWLADLPYRIADVVLGLFTQEASHDE